MSADKLRIALALDDSLDRPDGVQQYVLTLGAWYTAQGHEVHYICTNTSRTDLQRLHSLSSAVPIKFNKNLLSFAKPIKKSTIRKFFNDNKIDLLHVQLPHNPLFTGRLIAGAPKQTTVVGTFHVAPYGKIEHLAVNSLQYVYRQSRRKISKVYAVSSIAEIYAQKVYKLPVSVIPNAVSLENFHPNKSKPKKLHKDIIEIRFIGRLVPRKGCRYLVLAVRDLVHVNNVTNFKLTIGGKGPQLDELKSLVKQYNIEKYIRFAGFIPETDKAVFLQEADLVVFPSTGGESFGIVLIEAMAAGSVVLGGDNPGYRQVLVPKEALFEPENTEKFRNTLADFINHPAKRHRVAKIQHTHVQNFDVSKIGKKLINDYEEMNRSDVAF